MSKSVLVSLRIPDYLADFLNDIATREGRSRGDVMRRILQEPLANKWREEDQARKTAAVNAAIEERTPPFDPLATYPRSCLPVIVSP